MNIKGILPMYETCRGFCGIAVGDSILLSSSFEMHYCHIAPVETSNSTLTDRRSPLNKCQSLKG